MMKEVKDMEKYGQKDIYISYDNTLIIKGIALIFMFIHHFFTFPNWYIDGINYQGLSNLALSIKDIFKICVSIFAFLTGYFYCFNKDKSFKYSLRKITDILLSYWFVCFIITAIALIMGYINFNIKDILEEFLLLDCKIMCFCWYVRFYIISILVLPIFNEVYEKNKIIAIFFMSIILIILNILVFNWLWKYKVISQIFQEFIKYFPIIIIGFMFAKLSIFNKLENKIIKYINNKVLEIIIYFSITCIALLLRCICQKFYLGIFIKNNVFNIDIICAPIFIFGITNIIKKIKWRKLTNIFMEIGKYSLLMWFIHCIFFNVCNNFFQPILYWPNKTTLILIWGLILCYFMARVINIPIKKILEMKNNKFMKGKNNKVIKLKTKQYINN